MNGNDRPPPSVAPDSVHYRPSPASRRDGLSLPSSTIKAVVVRGHQVASGRNGDPRFPGGTLRMQVPYFLAQGLDLTSFYLGTVNISIAPLRYEVLQPRSHFQKLRWHPTAAAEDFSFFDVLVSRPPEVSAFAGFIYYPHPETKPEHHQAADVLELLLPFVPDLSYGTELLVTVPNEQLRFEARSSA